MGAIPVLTGIVEAPTLRPDGTILSEPGYDAATGLLLDTGGVDFPAVPERPTKEDAEEALRLIQDVIRAFPFKDEASKAAGVALMITPNVRKACRAVPLTVISAPKMAAGKTLLACVAGYARLGRMPTLMPPAGDPNEERKRLLGVLLDGDEIVVVDNVDGKMKSDALCTAVTEPVFTDRMLGVNDKVTARSGTMFVATGNNLAVVGDLSSRVVGCLLDPGCEHPEERRFDVNLHETVPAMLPRLVVAALTIVRAYLAAGEPMKGKLPNFARFEDWSRLVREPLKWLGMDDPCGGRDAVEARDTERAVLASLLLAWHESFGDEHVLTGEAVKRATREPPAANGATPTADELGRRERLLQAMEAAAPGAGKVSPVGLGRFMGRYEGRIEDGLRFVAKQVHKQSAWAALPTEGADTPAGSETSSDVNPRLGGDTEMGEMNPASRKRTVPTDACESCSGTGRITAVSRARLTH
jgi:hypothetical protein